jgi:D-arabinose 1-dehydrogenase-like Zn-dependent alcohol dehydrogenase
VRALTWQGKRDVRVETVPDPGIEQPTDAIVRITSTAICGWDLHLYEILSPFLTPGDMLGHEPMGSWRRSAPTCGRSGRGVAWWCRSPSPAAAAGCARGVCSRSARQLRSGTQGRGAAVFGSTSLYGAVPEIQLRMGQAHVKRWIEEIMPLVRADDDPLLVCA